MVSAIGAASIFQGINCYFFSIGQDPAELLLELFPFLDLAFAGGFTFLLPLAPVAMAFVGTGKRQIPILFSMYKVLFVTIEMYHAPFYGWIHDLSAPDPLGILILFGLIPWQVPEWLSIINIGILPIIMGFTMWLQQKLNQAPTAPSQAKIFAFLPYVFTFILAGFAAGLVLYWSVNNILSIAQQWLIQRKILAKKDA